MSNIKMENLLDAVKYLGEGWGDFPILVLIDDKKNPRDYLTTRTIIMSEANNQVKLLLEWMEREKLGLCFYPNGSTSDNTVQEIRWHFVDIDKGDKEEQLELILSAPLEPTMIYRGRAGHKVLYRISKAYWDVSSHQSRQQSIAHFKNIQQQLVEFFNGDGNVINPSHALRLPFVKNYKDWQEGKVYTEEVIFFNPDNIYTQQQLMEAFPLNTKKHLVKEYRTVEGLSKEKEEIIQLFMEYLDLEDLKYIDRGDRLSFQCPVHNDTSPSAYMFKENLIVHCSRGHADGECEISRGKNLGWVAEYKGWEDLSHQWKKLMSLNEEKYKSINISSMSVNEVIPLDTNIKHNKTKVIGILDKLVSTMQKRGIEVTEDVKLVYQNIIQFILSDNPSLLCVPLEPGGGKSTLMKTILEYLLFHDVENAGAIIVVERIETAKQLADSLGEFRIQIGEIDVPIYQVGKAAYVMESPFTSDFCKKDLVEYRHGICRGCSELNKCPIPRKYNDQKQHPIVIITHARLMMDKDRLKNYEYWYDQTGNKHKRKMLIIDEKPPLVQINKISRSDIDEFEWEFGKIAWEIEGAAEVKNIIAKLREKLANCYNDKGIFEAIDPYCSFNFKSLWYKKYDGTNVDLINQIEHLVRNGGWVIHNQQNKVSIYIQRINNYNFENYNTLILDGTSSIDLEYKSDSSFNFLEVPRLRTYESLSLHVAHLTLSKQAFQSNKDNIDVDVISENIKRISENDSVFVLCYKMHEPEFKEKLKKEIEAGQVKVDHFGNVKGSNKYVDCTAMVVAGTQHKGDAYYIAKYEAIYGKPVDTSTITINKVRRFKDIKLELLKLNDQLIDLIQDMNRIKVRIKNSTEPIKIFLPTNDKVLVNLLKEYFCNAKMEKWNLIEDSLPDWYFCIKEIFMNLKNGEVLRKKDLRKKLGLEEAAGKKKFQRIQKEKLFMELLIEFNIREQNRQTYIKDY